MKGLFITGTDTDVGKTFVTCLIARELIDDGHRVGVSKPACSGAEYRDGKPVWSDLEALSQAAGITDIDRICRQRFEAPLAPPVAAEQEGRSVDYSRMVDNVLAWRNDADIVLVEGVGGLLCPLTAHESVAEFARQLGFPLLIVARLGLGTINHTLLTVEAADRHGLTVSGIILNDGDNLAETPAGRSNLEQLQNRTSVPILGIVPFTGHSVCLRDRTTPARINWFELAETALPSL